MDPEPDKIKNRRPAVEGEARDPGGPTPKIRDDARGIGGTASPARTGDPQIHNLVL